MKRTPAVLLTSLALTVVLPVTAVAADPAEEKSEVDKRVEELTTEFHDLDEDLARVIAEKEEAERKLPGAEKDLGDAQDAVTEATEKDQELGARLTSAENARTTLQTQIDDGEQQIEDNQLTVTKIARQAYQNQGVTSDLALLLEMAEDTNGSAGITRVDSAVRNQQKTITSLTEQKTLNENNGERLDAITTEISGLKEEAAQSLIEKQAAEKVATEKKSALDELVSTKKSASETIEESKSKTADELEKEKQEQDRLAQEVEKWEQEQADKGEPPVVVSGDGTLGNPAEGYPITSQFGYRIHPITGTRKLHTGTDFGVPCGTTLHAAGDGVVVSAGWNGGYGNRVVISHGEIDGKSIASTYNHNTKVLVSAGDVVKKGDPISLSGTTGSSTGCHLHFEILEDGTYVDPLPFIQ